MNVTRWLAPILLVLLAGSNGANAESIRSVHGVVLESAITLNAGALNERLANTVAGERVRAEPGALVQELIGSSEETPYLLIEVTRDAKTNFNRATVTVVRDGFQDDSLRGDWHEFMLTRDASGRWTLLQARKALRCWRSRVDAYAARKCP